VHKVAEKKSPHPATQSRSSHSHDSFAWNYRKNNPSDYSAIRDVLHATGARAKLKIGQPNDRYEQEADRVADKVMRMTDADVAQRVESGAVRPMKIQRVCPECEEGLQRQPEEEDDEEERLLAKEQPGQTPKITPNIESGISSIKGGGKPLSPSVQSFFEPRFGKDLSHVRVHTGREAAESARAIQARAYTTNNHIVFGSGEYAPENYNGMRLLAHELGHIIHGHTGVLRQEGEEIPLETVHEERPATEPNTSSRDNSISDNFDPCHVEVGDITNAALLHYWSAAESYLQNHSRGQDRYFDYANLMRRLAEERRRRIRMGHAWLGVTGLTEVPRRMYEIIPGAGLTAAISLADIEAETGLPSERSSAVVTPDQFDDFLRKNGIPQMDVQEWYSRQGLENPEMLRLTLPSPTIRETADIYNMTFNNLGALSPFGFPGMSAAGPIGIGTSGFTASPFDLYSRGMFLNPIYTPNTAMTNPRSMGGAELNWRGNLPEASMMYGTYADIIRYRNFNRIQPNAPVFDTGTRFGDPRLISITHSQPGTGGQVNMGHYAEKVRIMSGDYDPRGTNLMNQALTLINQEYGTSWNVTDVNQRNFLGVPDDHVTLVQDAIETRVARQPSAYANLVDGLLSRSPITVGGTTYNSWNQVQAARSTNAISDADYRLLRQELGQRARTRIVGVGMTLPEITVLQQIRSGLQLQGFSEGQSSIIATPEVLEVRRLMATGIPEGQAINMVARQSAFRGAGMGAVVGLGTGLYQIATGDENDPYLWQRAGVGVPINAAGGAGQAYLETQITTRMMNPILSDATTSGSSSLSMLTSRGLLARGAGGFGAGGVIAPAVTWLGMGADELFFDADYYWGDYAAKGGRSSVAGAVAGGGGALAAGITGAIAGSEVPILGNIVGFGAGILIYWIVDSAVGEDIEQSIRDSAGEQGCTGQVTAAEDENKEALNDALGDAYANMDFCWVAREVLPEHWTDVRRYLLGGAPTWLRNTYGRYGKRFAAFIHDKPWMKAGLLPVFRYWAKKGRSLESSKLPT